MSTFEYSHINDHTLTQTRKFYQHTLLGRKLEYSHGTEALGSWTISIKASARLITPGAQVLPLKLFRGTTLHTF